MSIELPVLEDTGFKNITEKDKPEHSRALLYCFSAICRTNDISIDLSQLVHELGISVSEISENSILQLARKVGLKSKCLNIKQSEVHANIFPCILKLKDSEPVIAARINKEGVIIQRYGSNAPEFIPIDQVFSNNQCEVILFKKRLSFNSLGSELNFNWFLSVIKKYKKLLLSVLVASFFIQILALASPLFFQVIIDKVLVHHSLSTLDVLCVGLLVVSLFEVLLSGLRTYLLSHTTNRIDVELGAKLLSHLFKLPIAFFESRQVGNIVARVKELDVIRNFITGTSLTLVIDIFFGFIFLIIMYYYSATLFWVVAATLPAYVLLSAIITPILKRRLDEKFRHSAANQAFLTESVNGVETIKSLALEPKINRQWQERLAHYVLSSFKATNLNNIANQVASYISKLTTLLIIWIGAKLVINNEITMGQLIAFNMFAGRVSGPILRLVQVWQDFQQAKISLERLGDILKTKTEPVASATKSGAISLKGDIKFENVSFRYRADLPMVLENINLEIKSGTIVGIVGRSGSGKSTITKLVQRLYQFEKGSITIGGTDLTFINPTFIRQKIGVVLQENFLFNKSVKENIAFTDPAASMQRIVHVSKLAGAHEFIEKLPDGYDTVIGEYGRNLSGGQRQRLAIARALLTNPDILIFDEATSALDYESERIIRDNLVDIAKGRTVIMIAHRLSTIKDANTIHVIDEGELVESGSHSELLSKDGYYSKLHHYQFS